MDDLLYRLDQDLLAGVGLEPAAAAPPPELEPEPAFPPETDCGFDDMCATCGVNTQESAHSPSDRICPVCARIYPVVYDEIARGDGAVYGARPQDVRHVPPLRYVGARASEFQPELDRSAHTDTRESRITELSHELFRYGKQYQEAHGLVISKEVLRDVARTYVTEVVPFGGVMRAEQKQSVLALLLFNRCLQGGHAMSRQTAARFMQLTNGIARGENLLRRVGACIEDLNRPQESSQVDTIFWNIGIQFNSFELEQCGFEPTGPKFTSADAGLIAKLKAATLELLDIGEKKRVGKEFMPKTRAAGTVYVVLKRAALADLLPAHWLIPKEPASGERGSLEWLVAKCGTRTQTLKKFMEDVLRSYHKRLFRAAYKKHGLYAGAL
jgi:hypothetical protein